MSTTAHERPATLSAWLAHWRIDVQLFAALLCCALLGLFVLYSASGRSEDVVIDQAVRVGIGLFAMIALAQVPPHWYRVAAPWVYILGVILLVATLVLGDAAMGAKRWLDFGVVRFQPSEISKLVVPLTIAAYFHHRSLPPKLTDILVAGVIMAIPVALVVRQPDLGTALLIIAGGGFALFFAGLRWRIILLLLVLAAAAAPLVWFNLHDYQQQRVLTFLNPARDPLGAGYHITQSKIAIGSGGVFGKGWLNGSQAHLDFLPESDTDFVFAVYAEETGLFGVLGLMAIYGFIVARGLFIAIKSQDTFQRLTAASLSLTFFFYAFVNMGMVAGLLPVVGVPLPLISFGGTSMVMLLASFGILMSIHTHRKLLAT
ncbi:rod shape-determining protein RodA [Salinisphaera hydrothermalis]|uniref:Peptidoglycan glycosyltransferase MrdB n=1 Tax=Salinisphaera hydrothermalis (strain C41B8) TaxID=1304275 RepID=A0A084IL27_SALHC|nr:rod shape-determining protein RodA [Salinisphaera hydrothermalis]KEZ77411.1 rod shape-determining protein RodA [Salinisphaera hydrothermalis C41B8]